MPQTANAADAWLGPTGAGKSVVLALMALQFRRYAKAQIFALDFGGLNRRKGNLFQT